MRGGRHVVRRKGAPCCTEPGAAILYGAKVSSRARGGRLDLNGAAASGEREPGPGTRKPGFGSGGPPPGGKSGRGTPSEEEEAAAGQRGSGGAVAGPGAGGEGRSAGEGGGRGKVGAAPGAASGAAGWMDGWKEGGLRRRHPRWARSLWGTPR